jgi:hypothetical protein
MNKNYLIGVLPTKLNFKDGKYLGATNNQIAGVSFS